MDGSTSEAFARQVADSLRQYRKQQGLSLSELARRSGVAKGTLSRLEVGDGNPTIMTLAMLAAELHVSPSDFFSSDSGVESEEFVPASSDAGPVLDMRFLSRIRSGSLWELYETVIPQSDHALVSELHDGVEHLLILDGQAWAGPAAEPRLLKPGQHIAFAGNEPHLYWAKEAPARALLVMDYPLDQAS